MELKIVIESNEPFVYCPMIAHRKGGQSVLKSDTLIGFTGHSDKKTVIDYLKQYLTELLESGSYKLLRANRKAEIFDSIKVALERLNLGETDIHVTGGGRIIIQEED